MALGGRRRRGSAGLILVATLGLCGCHAMPLSRLEDAPNRPKSLASAGRAALLSATVAQEPPSEMSSIEPVNALPARLTPAAPNPPISAPEPTPLLDAALQRSKASQEPPLPDPPTTPAAPTEPKTPSPSSLFNAPLPIEFPSTSLPKLEPVAASSAEASSKEKEKEAEPPKPEELWRDGIRQLSTLARARLEQAGGSATPWALRSQILAWLAQPDIDPDVSPRETEGVRAVLRALDEPQGDAPGKGSAVRSAVLVLEDKAPLEIVDLKLCSWVDKFGEFEPFDPPVRKAGQEVVLYCEVDGLRFEQTAAGFRTRLAGQLEIVPEGGGPAVFSKSFRTAEETCRKRRRDYFIAYKFFLPRPLPPGDYRMRLTEKDLNSDHSATREVNFAVARD